jgi:hypothetical protein
MEGSSFSTSGNGNINNLSQQASNFELFGRPSNTSISIGSLAAFSGTVYAPQADFSLGGGGNTTYDFVGASVTKTVTVNGHFNFHFDENVSRVGPKYFAVLPSITAQPANATVNVNSNASFSVTATGTSPLSYQWRKDTMNITGATNATLSFVATNRSHAGAYSVQVGNSAGTATSGNAALRVLVPQRLESPLPLDNGRILLTSRDDGGSGVPDDLSKLILVSTDELIATNTMWTTNTTTTGFSITNGYLLIEDVGATNAAQRFYRIFEW